MKKNALICMPFLLTLVILTACNAGHENNETPIWESNELIREDYFGRSEDVIVPDNVITAESQTLTVFFNSSTGDEMEYGITELLQVYYNGAWYTLPYNLSARTEPLMLPALSPGVEYLSEAGRTEHTVDLSVTGGLPPGRYRLVEMFFWRRLQIEYSALAYFWVIEPGNERPPESETSGPAHMSDITLCVEAISEARRVVTDRDEVFSFIIENWSGKRYTASKAILEKKQGSDWIDVNFESANLGLLFGWESRSDKLYLKEPLAAGDYRFRLAMSAFDYNGPENYIEPECEFAVIAYEDAPEPKWDLMRLQLSPYDELMQSADVTLTLKKPVLNDGYRNLEFVISADDYYQFGEFFEIDVLLDGKWYHAPFANSAVPAIAYSIAPDTAEANRTYSCFPVGACAVLPAGQYRMIKTFDLYDPNASSKSPITYLAKEYAFAEFTVEETLEWMR